MIKRHRISILIAFVLLQSKASIACSCLMIRAGFLIRTGTTVPGNYAVIPYYSGYGLHGEYMARDEDWFEAQYMDSTGCWAEVSYSVRILSDSSFTSQPTNLEIIIPEGGFKSDTWYRFKHPQYPNYFRNPPGYMSNDIEIYVSSDTLDLSSGVARININNEKQEELRVLSLAGDCHKNIIAKQYEIEIVLASPMRKFKNALIHLCHIEGYGDWIFRSSYCTWPLPWTSSIGKGRELVYTYCDPCGDPVGEGILVCPDEGLYRVRMIAWMAGSEQHIEADTEIELLCDE